MDKKKYSILVIDDDTAILTMVKFLFGSKGFDVLIADNSIDGIQIAQDKNPDVILLDILMPGMDGCDFVKETAYMGDINDIPIVILTATGEAKKTCLLSQGVHDYIEKPFCSNELVKSVLDAIKKRRTIL